MEKLDLPSEIVDILKAIKTAGFEAYVVGGCARDLLMNAEPKDWDITTNAKPEEIQKIFPNNFYENKFGTVTILTGNEKESLKNIEITPFRIEGKYSDKRHPEEIKFAKTIEEDLSRRDFTINAIAYDGKNLIDLFDGRDDLENKLIRAVGDAEKRFEEDALRMMRAVRFAAVLNFKIEEKTFDAISKNAGWILAISKERVRDELVKIINSENAVLGVELLRESGLLKHIIPELNNCYGIGQNKHHIYDVYQHLINSLAYAVKKNYNFEVRMSSLFHDIGKPQTKRGEGSDSTFYNHEVVSAKITWAILKRLHFPNKQVEKIVKLVRYHLFYYNVGEVTESAVRRLLRSVGREDIDELLELRICDRIGSGVPKAEPYKLRHLRYLIDKVSRDPISVKMLKVNGADVMKILNIDPGPKVGYVLNILLDDVLENPEYNNQEFLEKKVIELGKLKDNELEEMSRLSESKRQEVQMKIETVSKKKYWVT